MAASRRHKRGGHHEEEHENEERWLVSFADMMTLLFCLFMVLFAISSVNTSKFEALQHALQDAFSGRILNVHPSLLPAFPGLHPQRQALDHGVKLAGATVHFVDEGVDSGPIILQSSVAVDADDTEESLSARILAVEHRLYPEAVRLFAEGRLTLAGRKVLVR